MCVPLQPSLYVLRYRRSGNIGDIFNLAVWQSGSKSPNFSHQIYINLLTMLCPYCATAKFNFCRAMLNYSLILCKSSNLMITNISGYTVCTVHTFCIVYMCMYVFHSTTAFSVFVLADGTIPVFVYLIFSSCFVCCDVGNPDGAVDLCDRHTQCSSEGDVCPEAFGE